MDPVNSVTGDDSDSINSDSINSVTGDDTTESTYWLNWRFFLCAGWVLMAVIISAVLIWKYEGFFKSRKILVEETQQETTGTVYMEDTWKTSCKSVHPWFLLCYRFIAFGVLLALIISDTIVNSAGIFVYYTEWTFTLDTIYFGLASVLSVYGCLHGWEDVGNGRADLDGRDPERGTSVSHDKRVAGFWGYTFQILYQTCAGAVALTDVVFWLVLYPFFTEKDFKLKFLMVCMHSVNAVCFFGDLLFNNLKFPFFRIAYFLLWTCTFVSFQWILHTVLSMDWPYPFLDISSEHAPIWYLGVGLIHLPCFGVISLITKAKRCCSSRSPPESHSNEIG